MMVDQALKRPSNYATLSPREQWAIDKRLGILDWEPTEEECLEFDRRWQEKVAAEKETG